MTDRVRTITVILELDTRDDDAEHFLALFRNIKGVASVELGEVVLSKDLVARSLARSELRAQLWDQFCDLLYPEFKKEG